MPPRIADEAVAERCYYKNAFTGAATLCEYRKNEIIFESECASTIAIAKENITRWVCACVDGWVEVSSIDQIDY